MLPGFPDAKAVDRLAGCDGATLMRDYYGYLFGLPMKLHDPGAYIHPELEQRELNGVTYDIVKVTYDPEVGTDIWEFYFHPDTRIMAAAQFYRDETTREGELILYEDYYPINDIQFPRKIVWLIMPGEKLLAVEKIIPR